MVSDKNVRARSACPLPFTCCLPRTRHLRLPSTVYCLLVFSLILSGCALFSQEPEIADDPILQVARAIEQAVMTTPDSPAAIEDQGAFTANVPEVVQILHRRQLRAPVVAEFKDKGYIGESARALIKYVRNPDCGRDSKLHARVAYLILSENDDRWALYEALADANGLSASGRKRIQSLFHQVRSDLARPGHLVQLEPGADWTKKPDAPHP